MNNLKLREFKKIGKSITTKKVVKHDSESGLPDCESMFFFVIRFPILEAEPEWS